MDLAKTLAELRQQRDDIDQAIVSLEKLAGGRAKRPGRPPGRSSAPKKTPASHTSPASDRVKIVGE